MSQSQSPGDQVTEAWRSNRPYLVNLAYQMLGDVGDIDLLRSEPVPRKWLKSSSQQLCERRLAASILAEAFEAVPVAKSRTWIGVAGTVTTLSAVAQDLPSYDVLATHLSTLSVEQIHSVSDHLLTLTHDERAAIPTIHPGRVDVIGGGAIILRVLADHLAAHAGITQITVSEKDILDGIALSLVK